MRLKGYGTVTGTAPSVSWRTLLIHVPSAPVKKKIGAFAFYMCACACARVCVCVCACAFARKCVLKIQEHGVKSRHSKI